MMGISALACFSVIFPQPLCHRNNTATNGCGIYMSHPNESSNGSGVATHYCPSEKLPLLEEKLGSLAVSSAVTLENVSATIHEVANGAAPEDEKAHLQANEASIRKCFGGMPSAEEIVGRLKEINSSWSEKMLKTLLSKSPLSVKVSLEALKRHQEVTLREAFIAEYRLSQWFMRKPPMSDFCEGIRAVLVDKDQAPKWQPSSLEEVRPEQVQEFFTQLPASHARGDLQI